MLGRSYQEKHLLLTEIQALKDQVLYMINYSHPLQSYVVFAKLRATKQNTTTTSSSNEQTTGNASHNEAEEQAWFVLLDLNQRANALAVYHIRKLFCFKLKSKAFKTWTRASGVTALTPDKSKRIISPTSLLRTDFAPIAASEEYHPTEPVPVNAVALATAAVEKRRNELRKLYSFSILNCL